MPLPDGLLNPIPGDNPSGKSLRYDPLYDKIREARREEDILPQGDWSHEVKKADYPLVIKLATEALSTKSKDLQIAAWLTEAILFRDHVLGLHEGLDLLRGLLETFWDTLYPEIEDDDLEFRSAPLAWVGSKLDIAVRRLPLTKNKLDFFKFQESRRVGYEADAAASDVKAAERALAIEEKKCTGEEFDEAVRATGDAFYEKLAANLVAALESVQLLETLSDEKFGREAPNFANLRTALEDLQDVVKHYYRPPAPEKEAEAAAEAQAEEVVEESAASAAGSTAPTAKKRSVTAEPADRDDAMQRLTIVAHFLRHENPQNPVPYLLLRAMRWGELRAAGTSLNATLLEAPPTEKRSLIKKLSMDGDWAGVLENAEQAMSLPSGRGWLDLQRYAVRACESLGSDYEPVAAGIRGELKTLLADYPDLLTSSLMDDTPAANAETQTWLKESILPPPPPPPAPSEPEFVPAAAPASSQSEAANGEKAPDVVELAMKAARAGKVQEAIGLLTREMNNERTGRGRFQRHIQLANIFLATKHEAIAYPILMELAEEIERRKLEEWEDPAIVAQPLALLYRCAEKLGRDDAEKQKIYQKLCRLDPGQALSLR
jgi:type VI secretion system protein ImpA